ncbi:hypothetical protein PanWU01x14_194070, partial [Parasponia andersonii]
YHITYSYVSYHFKQKRKKKFTKEGLDNRSSSSGDEIGLSLTVISLVEVYSLQTNSSIYPIATQRSLLFIIFFPAKKYQKGLQENQTHTEKRKKKKKEHKYIYVLATITYHTSHLGTKKN